MADLLSAIASLALVGSSAVILVETVLIYLAFRKLNESLLKVRLFMKAPEQRRGWFALILSFIVFTFFAVPQGLQLALDSRLFTGLLVVHLLLILYAFYQFYLVVRPQKSTLEALR